MIFFRGSPPTTLLQTCRSWISLWLCHKQYPWPMVIQTKTWLYHNHNQEWVEIYLTSAAQWFCGICQKVVHVLSLNHLCYLIFWQVTIRSNARTDFTPGLPPCYPCSCREPALWWCCFCSWSGGVPSGFHTGI